MKYSVKDGVRTLKFEGNKLSQSSSRLGNRPRWVEFELFRTPKGQYVLARAGLSVYYHSSDCPTVTRNKLSAVNDSEISLDSVPCPECRPSRLDVEGLFPETPRYWAQVSETAQGVVASLMKYDDNGTEYLTNVARRLLEDASENDENIAEAFYTDTIE